MLLAHLGAEQSGTLSGRDVRHILLHPVVDDLPEKFSPASVQRKDQKSPQELISEVPPIEILGPVAACQGGEFYEDWVSICEELRLSPIMTSA